MKTGFKLVYGLLLLSVTGSTQPRKATIISGKIKDETHSVYAVKIYYFNKYTAIADMSYRTDTTIYIDGADFFQWTVPVVRTGKIGQMVLYYDSTNKADNDVLDNYVVEEGDSVAFTIMTKDHRVAEVNVEGKGAAKYQCRSSVIMKNLLSRYARMDNTNTGIADNSGTGSILENWKKSLTGQVNFIKEVSKILDEYKGRMTDQAYKIMQADIQGEFYVNLKKMQRDILSFSMRVNDSTERENVRNMIYLSDIPSKLYNDRTVLLSPGLVDYVYEKEVTDISLEQCLDWKDVVLSFSGIFNRIKSSYDGMLRESLLTALVVNPNQNSGLIAMGKKKTRYVELALSIIKRPELKAIVKKTAISRIKEGDVVYLFSLPDTSGKIITASQLKGNVFLMDLWFTGCTGCVIFADKVKTIIKPALDQATQFKVVSINTDPAREMWIKSLRLGKYTETDNINLQSRQPGLDPKSFYKIPIISYYGLNYLPFILLIDKEGNIVCQFTNDDDPTEIIAKIKEALEK